MNGRPHRYEHRIAQTVEGLDADIVRLTEMRAARTIAKELYYRNPAAAMMAAPITVTGATLAPGAPVRLFPTRIVGGRSIVPHALPRPFWRRA